MNIWKQLAEETDGVFTEGYSWNSDSTTIEYKNWKIILDNYTVWSGKYSNDVTRVITPITLIDNFKFEIYTETTIRKIENFFGGQDIKIGNPDFDNLFTIKSNNEFKIKSVLKNKELQSILKDQKDVNIQISDYKGIWGEKLPENTFELSYYINGKVDHLKTLNSLISLFKIMLDELSNINLIVK
ncbi:hypothetical protein [Flavobacterium reichenbachii]|uniref:DUF3137 domain-containing protein n=1 Tax=Flavobacterium reichenbachii TaxID=362418 RepID=A0A085ZP26_9FLAO|nr:hypothetical protein [Flavobacterium reichenbachii]KFF06190.1 hypothetical protein IW19_11905 [Flavobacterium reichenbachii]OXB17587.1 hypothetical protein B0A68_04665 [Flavobacterium reichenbachii]